MAFLDPPVRGDDVVEQEYSHSLYCFARETDGTNTMEEEQHD
jgi:hypothetical protein